MTLSPALQRLAADLDRKFAAEDREIRTSGFGRSLADEDHP